MTVNEDIALEYEQAINNFITILRNIDEKHNTFVMLEINHQYEHRYGYSSIRNHRDIQMESIVLQ